MKTSIDNQWLACWTVCTLFMAVYIIVDLIGL